MSTDFAIVCKTYRPDLRRAQRLINSIATHNKDRLRVAVIVPAQDLDIFRNTLPANSCELLSDEDVVAQQPGAKHLDLLGRYRATAGNKSQQVIKAEAWRALGCSAYLCTDADAVFLRDFRLSDFMTPNAEIYTQIHQSKDYLTLATNRGHPEVRDNFLRESSEFKTIFGRQGPDYDFGPIPAPWSAKVWNDLSQRYLEPRKETLWDAIEHAPCEMRWYGESLLAWGAIPILPIEPLFRVYHYDWQFSLMQKYGETKKTITNHYLGAVYQSNWQYEMDMPGHRTQSSIAIRKIKRWIRA
jgi:hypothetical protein